MTSRPASDARVITDILHTPTPWRTDNMGNILVGGHTVLATICPFHVSADEAAANTLFLLRAVNAHDALVKAGQDLLNAFDDGPAGVAGKDSGGNICIKGSVLAYVERLRAALAKVGGAS